MLRHSSSWRPTLLATAAATLAILAAAGSGASGQTAPAAAPAQPAATRPARASFTFLPDSALLAQVGERRITVKDFLQAYYTSYPEYRPRPDSAGRAEFLRTMVDKEVLAKAAKSTGRKETFEERAAMQAYAQRVLSNVLFQRAVIDSVRVGEADVDSTLAQMKRELRLQRLRFGTRSTAERMRADLLANRTSWSKASAMRVFIPGDTSTTGEMGWRTRNQVPPPIAHLIFALPVGGISPIVVEAPSYALYRVAEERPYRLQMIPAIRANIREELLNRRTQELSEQLIARLRAEVGMRVDSLNVAWAAARFPAKFSGAGSSNIVIDVTIPSIAPEDTGRVLATYNGGRISVGGLLEAYKAAPDFQRPSLNDQDAVRRQVDLMVLEPRMAAIARARGLERDSLAIALIEKRHEELLVDRLYQDSIMAKVFVAPAARRQYYKDNEYKFVTSGSARFARFYLSNQENADTMAARLRRGVPARDIIHADSLENLRRGRIETLAYDDHGAPYHKRLFEEMRPGEVVIDGPDAGDGYTVLQLIQRDSGRQVGFEEADQQIDDYLQQQEAEKLLAAFMARHRSGVKIVMRPGLVGRINMVDPTR